MSRIQELREKTLKGFFGFWIIKYRISFLIIIGIIIFGIISAISIPKESSPSINFGMISINTVYPGTNSNDIDSLITDKIYKEIKDIKGIDKIKSSSSLGFSSMIINLKTDANSKDIVNEIRNNVNRIVLPENAKSPIITELNTSTKQLFTIYLYKKDEDFSKNIVLEKAKMLKNKLENINGVECVNFANGSLSSVNLGGGSNSEKYDINILIDSKKLEKSGLTIGSIASVIKSWNNDIPIGNFEVGGKNYDFRIQGKYSDAIAMLDIPLQIKSGNYIKLGDIAEIKREYKDKSIKFLGEKSEKTYNYISLVVNKTQGSSIFGVSKNVKDEVSKVFETKDFEDYSYTYGNDMSEAIIQDYKELAKNALSTLLLVFIAMYLFVGFRDSLFASISLPLSFLSTFIILNSFGYSLNFLTNFSLILSFGIAVDTIIVIVQAASSKIRIGYDTQTAIILALKEYYKPVISGVMTTIVAFIPMMFLPGIMGKFLAYIPITIFGVLASGLVLVLTINSALYLLFVRKQKKYVNNTEVLEYATSEEKELLELEREGKTEISKGKIPVRIKIIGKIVNLYKNILTKILKNKVLRILSILTPIILFVLGFKFLLPNIGLELFPSSDNDYMSATIKGEDGSDEKKIYKEVKDIGKYLGKYKEIKHYSVSINGNTASVSINLEKKQERDEKGLMSVFDLEKKVSKDLEIYEKKGLKVSTEVLKGGPPGGSAIGLKLVAKKSDNLQTLIDTAKIFEKKLKEIKGTKSVSLSSKDTPGQFIFTFKKEVLGVYSIPPNVIYSHILQMMNGFNVGSVEDNGTDMDIKIKQSNFKDKININDILNSSFSYMGKQYLVGNFVEYNTKNSIESIYRENGKITINVGANLNSGANGISIQKEIEKFAKGYNFPSGISYEKGGENEENKDLIIAVFSSLFIAILTIFSILTLQFNSYSKPIIIFYSVFMSFPIVMLGLILTNNSFSMPFGIGFVSFTGIAVNHGIILIDAINLNLKKGMNSFTALIEAGASRLEPMVLTTLTTTLGILPIALKDKFWAGMGFTIIFGILSATFLSLFVLKSIYYEIYFEKIFSKFKRLYARIITLIINILSLGISSLIFPGNKIISAIIFLTINIIIPIKIKKSLGMKILNLEINNNDNTSISRKKFIFRIIIELIFNIIVFGITFIIYKMKFSILYIIPIICYFLYYGLHNFNKENGVLHDKITKTKVVEKK